MVPRIGWKPLVVVAVALPAGALAAGAVAASRSPDPARRSPIVISTVDDSTPAPLTPPTPPSPGVTVVTHDPAAVEATPTSALTGAPTSDEHGGRDNGSDPDHNGGGDDHDDHSGRSGSSGRSGGSSGG